MPTPRLYPSPRRRVPFLPCLLVLGVVLGAPAIAKDAPREQASAAAITAERALRGMLVLIRDTPSVAALTPEAMGVRMGLPVKPSGSGRFGFAHALTGGWAFSVEWQQVPAVGPRVDLIFSPVAEDNPPPGAICTPDFKTFTSELERMGFARQRAYGEHGRWTFDAFDRPGQHVEVYPRVDTSSSAQEEGTSRQCVAMVLVR